VVRIKLIRKLLHDTRADAVVEATILFPIIIMIFAALVLLSMYLPTRASLHRATQFAATAVATNISDTWVTFNEGTMTHNRFTTRAQLSSVYTEYFARNSSTSKSNAERIATKAVQNNVLPSMGTLDVKCDIVNYIIYKEVIVTAIRKIPISSVVNLSFIGFPGELVIAVTSTAVVVDGDGFVRTLDLAEDYKDSISGLVGNVTTFMRRFGIG